MHARLCGLADEPHPCLVVILVFVKLIIEVFRRTQLAGAIETTPKPAQPGRARTCFTGGDTHRIADRHLRRLVQAQALSPRSLDIEKRAMRHDIKRSLIKHGNSPTLFTPRNKRYAHAGTAHVSAVTDWRNLP